MSEQPRPPKKYWCVVSMGVNFTGWIKEEFAATFISSDAYTVFFDLEDGTRKVFNMQKILWYTVKLMD